MVSSLIFLHVWEVELKKSQHYSDDPSAIGSNHNELHLEMTRTVITNQLKSPLSAMNIWGGG